MGKKRIKKWAGKGEQSKEFYEAECPTCGRKLKMKIWRKPKCPECDGTKNYPGSETRRIGIRRPAPVVQENNTDSTSSVENN